MGTIECSQPASKSWDSQDFGDISMVLKWPIFASPPGHDELNDITQNNWRDYGAFREFSPNTWHNDNVVITSKQHHFDVIKSKWRRFT